MQHAPETRVDLAVVEAVLNTWPSLPQNVARRMLDKYGAPNEASPSRLTWFRNAPWHRTIVYRDEVPHNFPKPHTDVLEQVISYRVPSEKLADIAAFDGSVVAERTTGEVRVRCDMEAMNFLSLSLMHDIVTGRRTVDEARKVYAETGVAYMRNRPAPYTEKFQFKLPAEGTADRGTTMISKAMLDQTKAKMKETLGASWEREPPLALSD